MPEKVNFSKTLDLLFCKNQLKQIYPEKFTKKQNNKRFFVNQ